MHSHTRASSAFAGCALALSLLACGCQTRPWATAADRGSLRELQQTVQQRLLSGSVDRDEVNELAHAVARREIRSATDPQGEALLGQLHACASAVAAPLWKRSQRSDHTAGVALLTLVESGRTLSPSEWNTEASSRTPSRRAAAALSSNAPERWMAREALLNDADALVRRAALKSTQVAPAEHHLDTLAAILRHDPDLESRELAARSLGILGGPVAETVLSDAFSGADTRLRLSIVSAWAQASTFHVGGEQRLVAVARAEAGIVGVLAAADLARGTSQSREIGRARIARSLEFGAVEDLELAILAAEWSDAAQATSLIRLGLRAEPSIRALALGRWLDSGKHRWPALTWLRGIAEGDDNAAIVARSQLARIGDRSVVGALRRQLRYAKWQSRAQAGRDLWQLEDFAGVSNALTDDAPEVRLAVACSALAQAPKGPAPH